MPSVLRFTGIVTGILYLFSCTSYFTDVISPEQNSGGKQLRMSFNMAGDPEFTSIAARADVVISAEDMKTITQPLTIAASTISGTISNVPVGTNRFVELKVYDSIQTMRYYGSAYTDITANRTTNLSIKVKKLTGTLIISGTLEEDPVDPPQQDLMVYYPFNGNAADESDQGFNGIVYGAELTTDRFGNPNSAYHFDGIDDSIVCMNSNMLNFDTSDFTIAFWVKTFANDLPVMSKVPFSVDGMHGSPYENGWQIHSEMHAEYYSGIRFDMYDGSIGGYGILNSTAATDGQWHFVTIIAHRANTIQMYVDTVLQSERDIGSFGSIINNAPIRLGVRGTANVNSLDGDLDDIRMYKRAITFGELHSLYREGGWQ